MATVDVNELTYVYCSDDALTDVQVSLSISSETQTEEYSIDNKLIEVYESELEFTIPSEHEHGDDLIIDYKYEVEDNLEDGGDPDVYNVYEQITIPANETSATVTFKTREVHRISTSGGYEVREYKVNDVDLKVQSEYPDDCGAGCTVSFDNVVPTQTSVRGSEDGSIEVTIQDNQTDDIDYLLDGELIETTSATSYTFNDLSAGTYEVTVRDGDDCVINTEEVVQDGEFRTGDFRIRTTSPEIKAANNSVIYNVQTAVNSNDDKYFKGVLKIFSSVDNNYSIKFTITSPQVYSVTFYAKSFPNKSNYFLATETKNLEGVTLVTNTIEEVAQSLYEVLSNDIVLSNIYEFKLDGNDVEIHSRNVGSKYNLNYEEQITIYNQDGDLISDPQSGDIRYTLIRESEDRYDGQATDNYSVYGEVFLHEDTQYPDVDYPIYYTKLADLVIPFQYDNNHKFDISEIVNAHVKTNKPVFDFTGYTVIRDYIKPVYIVFGESYPIIPNSNTIKRRKKAETDPIWVTNSSFPLESPNDMSMYVGTERKFVTNAPNPLQVQRQQKLYNYFIIEKDYGSPIYVKGNIQYWDGTDDLEQDFITITDNNRNTGGLLSINLSYDALGLDEYEEGGSVIKKIKYVDYYIEDGDSNLITETRRIMFNINEQPRKYSLMFQNTLGTYDTFDCIGVVEEEIDREYGEYTINPESNLDGSLNPGFKKNAQYNTKITKLITVNTGFLDEEHLDWLANNLLTSNNIYSISGSYERYLILEDSNYIKSSQEDLFSIELNFKYTTYSNNIKV